MRRAISNKPFYIITVLLSIAFIFPSFFQHPSTKTLFLDENAILASILRSLPILAFMLFITLYGSKKDRRRRGWGRPGWFDISALIILFCLTSLLSILFPATDGSYSVSLHGAKGVFLILLFSMTTALIEELFFRSWLISGLRAAGWSEGFVFSIPVIFFAFLHLWQGWNGVVFAGLSAVLYSAYFMQSPILFTIILSHTIHNALVLIIASG